MSYRFIVLRREGIAWHLEFNRPERRNALNHAMMAEIGDAVDRVGGDRNARALVLRGIGGAYFRPTAFEPTFHKFQGRICRGLEIHPYDKKDFKPYRTSLTILEFILKLWPDEFAWKQPPYEYEYDRMPIDLILGDKAVRTGLEAGKTVPELEMGWSAGLDEFRRERERYMLYPDCR